MAKSRFEYVKQFEQDDRLLLDTWIVIRIDGKQFRPFTEQQNFVKPQDDRGIKLMNRCAAEVMHICGDVVLAIGASDEFSFVLRRDTTLFNRRAQKLATYICSLFTAQYTFLWNDYFGPGSSPVCAEFSTPPACASPAPAAGDAAAQSTTRPCMPPSSAAAGSDTGCGDKEGSPLRSPPSFDGRAVVYPTDKALRDYLSWRQADYHINSMYNTAFWGLVQRCGLTPQAAEATLGPTNSEQKHEIMFSRAGINYAKLPAVYRKGSVLIAAEDATEEERKVCAELLSWTPSSTDDLAAPAATAAGTAESDAAVLEEGPDAATVAATEATGDGGDEGKGEGENAQSVAAKRPRVAPASGSSYTDSTASKGGSGIGGRRVLVLHSDLISDPFWSRHPWLMPYVSAKERSKAAWKAQKAAKKAASKAATTPSST